MIVYRNVVFNLLWCLISEHLTEFSHRSARNNSPAVYPNLKSFGSSMRELEIIWYSSHNAVCSSKSLRERVAGFRECHQKKAKINNFSTLCSISAFINIYFCNNLDEEHKHEKWVNSQDWLPPQFWKSMKRGFWLRLCSFPFWHCLYCSKYMNSMKLLKTLK